MRIALKPPGQPLRWLAGQPGISESEFPSAGAFALVPSIEKQQVRRLRAAGALVLDRRNLLTAVSWETSRLFATVQAAALFALDYDAGARAGTLIFETPLEGGGVSRRYLANAVVDPPTRKLLGITVLLSYSASGGIISSINPDT